MSDRKLRGILYRWRVRAGTPALVGAFVLARPSWESLIAGIGLSLFGLGLRAWAAGHLRKEKELAVSGPYRFTRNPLYLGTLLIGAGLVAAARSWPAAALLAAYFTVFYPVIVWEERARMRALFPETYGPYERAVPLFLPVPGRTGEVSGARFDGRLFRKNKELRAVLGTIAFWGLMVLKMLVVRWPR
ncbi:MAG TPA: methyltransferase [Acidobacteriota bacterium]|nr:methyltransferase [Acidobacteriota bacterium]